MSSEDDNNQLTSDKEALLALLMEEDSAPSVEYSPAVLKVDRSRPLPLSYVQERMWFLEQLEPGSSLYNFHSSLVLTGPLNAELLISSLEMVIRRHEVLRATFHMQDGIPVQVIADEAKMEFAEVDLSSMSAGQQSARLTALSNEQVRIPFDLESGPLLRVLLVKSGPVEHHLLITTHHLVLDAWGLSILLKDLTEVYRSKILGTEPDLVPIEYQYVDIAYTQRHLMESGRQKELLDYWKTRLTGIEEPLDLPSDRPRPDVQSIEGDRVLFDLPAEKADRLREFSRAHKVTPFMTMLAVFKILLYRYTGKTDLVVGVPAAERTFVEAEPLVGVFVNNLVLRSDLSAKPDFLTFLEQVSETCLEAFTHQALPFEKLVGEMKLARDLSRSPLFQVMFVYMNVPVFDLELEGLSIELEEFHSGSSECDLSLYVRDREDHQHLECWLEYSTALFDQSTILRMKVHYLNLLDDLLAYPSKEILHASMISSEERNWLTNSLNTTASEIPDLPVFQAISIQSAGKGRQNAVCCENDELTYEELEQRSNKLANFLSRQDAGPGTRIGVLLDRDQYMMVGLLGVWKAGAAYVPLDPGFPLPRISYMCENSASTILLTTQSLLVHVPETEAKIICLDLDWPDIDDESSDAPTLPFMLDHVAYVIYTSGSTGNPKGVEVTHRNVINFIHSMSKRPGFTESDSLLAVTTISFDIHVLELFLPLYCGGRLVIASREAVRDGFRLLNELRTAAVTVMQATPATWQMLINSGWDDEISVKVLCGGEKLSRELASALISRVGRIWNMYGPTETTVWSAVSNIENVDTPITIGKPIDNTQLYVVDGEFELLPVGVPGELLIGGAGVANGYHQRPDLTAERFPSIPATIREKENDKERLYQTGDLARYLGNGEIEILGRLDNQIKLRGYRIEAGEIEQILENHDAISQAVVILREDNPGDKRLVAYLLASGEQVSSGILRQWIEKLLPEYMVPSAFVWLKDFPKTPNNKVDRARFPKPDLADVERNAEFNEPQTNLEIILADIFETVLGIEDVGRYDNFFDLGGHSLLSMKVVSQFEERTGIRMQPAELFQQTIGQIAAYHKQADPEIRAGLSQGFRAKLSSVIKSITR